MWLKTPEKIENILLESNLEPSDVETERVQRHFAGKGFAFNPQDLTNLPIVSIGKPETFELTSIYKPDEMPALLRAQCQASDFYLVRLCCSFIPVNNKKQLEWARFIVELHSNSTGQEAIAYDLYPMMVATEIKRNIKLNLGPTLNFQAINVAVGSIDFGIEYIEIQPSISAAGVGSKKPSWDYQETLGIKIQGSKFMYMIMKAPKGMRPIEASLDLVADVKIRDYLLPVVVGKEKATANLHRVKLIG